MFIAAIVFSVAVFATLLAHGERLLSAGVFHTCTTARTSAALYCFGNAANGRLGYGGLENQTIPTLVAAPLLGVRVSAVSASNSHTCAVTEVKAELYCFGYGLHGQLGHGGSDNKLVPTLVEAPLRGVRVSAVSAGGSHSCAITELLAALYCFRRGEQGQLGHGGTQNQMLPTPVAAPLLGVRVSAVSVRGNATCAITEQSATLYCWGRVLHVPTAVAGQLEGVRVSAVSVGQYHSCAVTEADAALYCFGAGSLGQLGNGGTDKSPLPTVVVGDLLGVRVSTVTVGNLHTCTITEMSAELFCWGRGSFGLLGHGGIKGTLVPTRVAAPLLGVRVLTVSAGGRYTCAITQAYAELFCFGEHFGLVPVRVEPPDPTTPVVTTSTTALPESTTDNNGDGETTATTTLVTPLESDGVEWQLPVLVAAPLLLLVIVIACIMMLVVCRRKRRGHRSAHRGEPSVVHRRAARASVTSSSRSRGPSRSNSMKALHVHATHHTSHYGKLAMRDDAAGEVSATGDYARGNHLLLMMQQKESPYAKGNITAETSHYARGDIGFPE